MAMSVGRRERKGGRYRPLAEINVTPLVDVMLVLLIVFMVTAPLMTSGVNVDLPQTNANPVNQDSEPLVISINAEGKIFLQETELPLAELASKLTAISDNKMDRRILVRGDKALNYGRILEVMTTITQGGFTKVALISGGPPATPQAAAPSTAAPAPTAPAQTAPTSAPARPRTR